MAATMFRDPAVVARAQEKKRRERRERRERPLRPALIEPHHRPFERDCLLRYSFVQLWRCQEHCRRHGLSYPTAACPHCGQWHPGTERHGGGRP